MSKARRPGGVQYPGSGVRTRLPSPRGPLPSRERGFALLLVMLLSSIAIVVVSELAYQSSLEYLAASNVSDIGKIEYAIDGQFELATAHLAYDMKQDQKTDSEFDEWNSSEQRGRVDGDVQLTQRIFDEQGKFDVMRLVQGNDAQQGRAKKMLVDLIDLFRDGISAEKDKGGDIDVGTAEELADKIQKYMKREGGSGQVPKPKTTPANQLLLLDELGFADNHKLIPKLLVDQKVGDKVAPGLQRYLTVYGTGKVNLNTAPLPVLQAEFPNLQDRSYAQGIIDRRRASPDASAPTTGTPGMTAPAPADPNAAPTQGNPFADVGGLTDGSVQGLTQDVLLRNGIDPAVEFDVKSDYYTIRIEGATTRTQRNELYAVQRVKTTEGIGFRYLLHQERTDRLLDAGDDVTPSSP